MGMTAVKMMVCDQEISTALAQNWGRIEETARNAGRDENTCWPRELKRQEGVKQKGQGKKQAFAERELLSAKVEKIWGLKVTKSIKTLQKRHSQCRQH